MGLIVTELRSTIARLGLHAEELSPARFRSIFEGIRNRFLVHEGGGRLWERIRQEVSVQNPDAWRWISSVPLSGRAILFLEEHEEVVGFAFDSADDVVKTLAESTGFEFYVTNESMSFLLAFNHHDYLSAAGDAVEWLRALVRRGALTPDS
jgi:hypothetical protein